MFKVDEGNIAYDAALCQDPEDTACVVLIAVCQFQSRNGVAVAVKNALESIGFPAAPAFRRCVGIMNFDTAERSPRTERRICAGIRTCRVWTA